MIAVQGPRAREIVAAAVRPAAGKGPLLSSDDGTAAGQREHRHQPHGVYRRRWVRADRRQLRRRTPIWEALLEIGQAARRGRLRAGGARHLAARSGDAALRPRALRRRSTRFRPGWRWAIKLDKGDFVGRKALEGFKQRPPIARVGLMLHRQSGSLARAAIVFAGRSPGR